MIFFSEYFCEFSKLNKQKRNEKETNAKDEFTYYIHHSLSHTFLFISLQSTSISVIKCEDISKIHKKKEEEFCRHIKIEINDIKIKSIFY